MMSSYYSPLFYPLAVLFYLVQPLVQAGLVASGVFLMLKSSDASPGLRRGGAISSAVIFGALFTWAINDPVNYGPKPLLDIYGSWGITIVVFVLGCVRFLVTAKRRSDRA